MASTITIRNTLDWAMAKPSLTKVLGSPVTGLGGTAIPIRIANKVLQDILQDPFAWKWNSRKPAPFVTNQIQSDYSTSITDLGWMENCERVEINNPIASPPSAPLYPIRGVEVVRELSRTSVQGMPLQISWLPNSEAVCGKWQANTTFIDPSLGTQMPSQELLQVRDPNGNIQVLTQFGTTGSTEPAWQTTPNAVTTDGTVQWTMADPNGITWRISPLPPIAGIVYLIQPYYQKKPTTITNLSQVWTVPDENSNLCELGFTAYAYDAAEDFQKFQAAYELFQAQLKLAIRSNDREPESFCMYPGRSLTGIAGTVTRGDEQWPPGLWGYV